MPVQNFMVLAWLLYSLSVNQSGGLTKQTYTTLHSMAANPMKTSLINFSSNAGLFQYHYQPALLSGRWGR